MHLRNNRRTPAIRISVHIEGVIRNPVHQPARVPRRRRAVVMKRPLRIGQRINCIMHKAEVDARLDLMSPPRPRHHIRKLRFVLIGKRLAPQRRRAPKRKSIRPNRNLRRESRRPHRWLLRQRTLRLLILQIPPILHPQLLAELRRRVPNPPAQQSIHFPIAAPHARPAHIRHRGRSYSRGRTRPRPVILHAHPMMRRRLPVHLPEIHRLVLSPRNRPGQTLQIIQRRIHLRRRHAPVAQQRCLRRRQRIKIRIGGR